MSDSNDELYGSLGPTTPVAPVRARSKKPNSVAGPSSKPTTKSVGKRNRSPQWSEIEEVHPLAQHKDIPSEHDDDVEVAVVPPGNVRGKRTTRSGGVGANGKTKGKGKEKSVPPPKSSRALAQTVMEADDVELIENTEGERTAQRTTHSPNATTKAKKSAVSTSQTAKVTMRELERMRRKLDMYEEVVKQRDTLSHQLEDLFRVRETDSERALQQQGLQYEARIQTQELLIKELTSQVAHVEPLIRSGKSSVLHLLTREAADKEKMVLEKELIHWRESSKEKDHTISEQGKRIAELEQLGNDQRYELQAEIERSKALASKASQIPPSAPRGRAQGGIDNPKNTEVIKLYEDLTNLLVFSLKFQPSRYLNLEDACFSCVYTYVSPEVSADTHGEKKRKSLRFNLRCCHEPIDSDDAITSLSQLREMVEYTPLELDKETEEFVKMLDFLGGSFTFARNQLQLFIDTLQKHLRDPDGGEGEEQGAIQ